MKVKENNELCSPLLLPIHRLWTLLVVRFRLFQSKQVARLEPNFRSGTNQEDASPLNLMRWELTS